MRNIVVNKKTGFRILDPTKPVVIRDNRGLLFYTTEPVLPNVQEFNLPGYGNFIVDSGSFTPMEKPVKYPLDTNLPPLIPRHPCPYNFEIVWGTNKNKCTIKWNEEQILFDSSFLEKPLPQVMFILFHEYAHQFFEDESYCDRMSGNYMKHVGFNPEQIGEAPILALSEKQVYRKQKMVDSLIEADAI